MPALTGRAKRLLPLLCLIAACSERGGLTETTLRASGLARAVAAESEWSDPINFGPTINTPYGEHNPVLSKDGLSLYFASDRPGGSGGWDLYVARRTTLDAPWDAPENLGSAINSGSFELAPYLSRDGHWLYFASNRPGGHGALDIYASWREDVHDDHAWGSPVNLGPEVNGLGPESPMSIHGPDFYFAKNLVDPARDPSARFHIFVSEMRGSVFGPPVLVTELNSEADDRAPSIRFDGREIFLTSNRAGGFGDYDLWVSTRPGDGRPWSTPVNLGPRFNTQYLEVGPTISEDGGTLLFVSNRPGGSGSLDLYYATRTVVPSSK